MSPQFVSSQVRDAGNIACCLILNEVNYLTDLFKRAILRINGSTNKGTIQWNRFRFYSSPERLQVGKDTAGLITTLININKTCS